MVSECEIFGDIEYWSDVKVILVQKMSRTSCCTNNKVQRDRGDTLEFQECRGGKRLCCSCRDKTLRK